MGQLDYEFVWQAQYFTELGVVPDEPQFLYKLQQHSYISAATQLVA